MGHEKGNLKLPGQKPWLTSLSPKMSNTTTLKLIWDDQEYGVNDGFKFKIYFQIEQESLYCAEFLPPLQIDDETLRYIHFTDFAFWGIGFTFFTPVHFDLLLTRNYGPITMKLITPGTYIYKLLWFYYYFSSTRSAAGKLESQSSQ
jgi:hypothetical protein